MLIYDRNIVTEGGMGLEEELISKKELLEQYQISYGALYRWKRMGLIPEGWLLDLVTHNWKLRANDRFGLLLVACKDCIGSVVIREVTE